MPPPRLGTTTAGNFLNALSPASDGLPAFSFVSPGGCNDMHDCSVTVGDDWLKQWIPVIQQSAAYQSGQLVVFITWDESEGPDKVNGETCWDAAHADPVAYPSCHVATIVLSPYAPLPGDAPTILMAPHGTALYQPEEDDAATVIMARYRPPVTNDATMLMPAHRPRWWDDEEATVVMAAVPVGPGAAPAGPAGQVSRRTVPHLAPEVRPGVRSLTAAEALPATIVANGKLDKWSRGRFYLELLVIVMVAAAIGSILVLWIRR